MSQCRLATKSTKGRKKSIRSFLRFLRFLWPDGLELHPSGLHPPGGFAGGVALLAASACTAFDTALSKRLWNRSFPSMTLVVLKSVHCASDMSGRERSQIHSLFKALRGDRFEFFDLLRPKALHAKEHRIILFERDPLPGKFHHLLDWFRGLLPLLPKRRNLSGLLLRCRLSNRCTPA